MIPIGQWITPVIPDEGQDNPFWCDRNHGTTILDQERWLRILNQIRDSFLKVAPYLAAIVRNIFLKLPNGVAVLVWDGSSVPALPTLTKFWAIRVHANNDPNINITLPLPRATIYQLGQSIINYFDVPWPGSENWYYFDEGSEPALGTTFTPVRTFSMVRDTWNSIEPFVITGLILYLLNKLGLFSVVQQIIRQYLDIRQRKKVSAMLNKINKGVVDLDEALIATGFANEEILSKIHELDSKIGLRLAFH